MGLIFLVLRFDYGFSLEIGVLIRVPKDGNLVERFLLLQFKKFQVLKFHLKIPEHSTLTSKREWSAVKLQVKNVFLFYVHGAPFIVSLNQSKTRAKLGIWVLVYLHEDRWVWFLLFLNLVWFLLFFDNLITGSVVYDPVECSEIECFGHSRILFTTGLIKGMCLRTQILNDIRGFGGI